MRAFDAELDSAGTESSDDMAHNDIYVNAYFADEQIDGDDTQKDLEA